MQITGRARLDRPDDDVVRVVVGEQQQLHVGIGAEQLPREVERLQMRRGELQQDHVRTEASDGGDVLRVGDVAPHRERGVD
ncbi:MAG: hypothetical protein J2P39_09475 [Candidatus Dormibacteraeota bacterium]|nr:hypothetical protein [Candidatus Dormibacteraeota bacterium]